MTTLPVYNVQDEFQEGFDAPMTTATPDIVVHHAAALYRQQRGIDDVREVRNYHVRNRGWSGIGYHVALAEEIQGGPIARYNLSPLNVQRAHVAMRNHTLIGVSCLTNFDSHANRLPEQKWFDALVTTLRDLLTIYPKARILGHKEAALAAYPTSCPGARWAEWKPRLLTDVNAPAAAPAAPALPPDTYPVGMQFLAYWQTSGGVWRPNAFAPGYAVTPVFRAMDGNLYQNFERMRLRCSAGARVEALLNAEKIPDLKEFV